jgi:hypothetical protein|tara:strand:+ start:1022 stop:1303 length:282 start_codon:yes stop_codon:yes gene_type:complete
MSQHSPSFWFTAKGLTALGIIGAASYFLLMEHREHLFEFLPYLILLLCPFMHIFMHSGHGNSEHDHHGNDSQQNDYQRGLEDGRRERGHQPKH